MDNIVLQNYIVDVKSNTLRRKLSQLLELAQEETTRREEKERELEYQAYIQKLEELAKIRDRVWEQVFKAISLKRAKSYSEAVAHLIDLRDLAQYQGNLTEFQAKTNQIKTKYSRLSGLISRLQEAGLIEK